MSSVEFQTENAQYRFIYTNHNFPVKDEILEDGNSSWIDAFVLQRYYYSITEYTDLIHPKSPLKEHYEKIFETSKRRKIASYAIDVIPDSFGLLLRLPLGLGVDFVGAWGVMNGARKIKKQIKEKNDMNRRDFLKFWGIQSAKVLGGAFLASDWACIACPTLTGYNPQVLARLNSARTRIIPTPYHTLREAIYAKKIEESIVPELRDSIPNRKVRLVLAYDSAHSGLKAHLQSSSLRNFYIKPSSLIGFQGIYRDDLDTITRTKYDKTGERILETRKAKLF